MTQRNFGQLTITANWEKIDELVNKLVANDTKKELEAIGFSLSSVNNGVLCDNFTLIVAGEERASFELEQVAGDACIEWARNYEVPCNFVSLWEITT